MLRIGFSETVRAKNCGQGFFAQDTCGPVRDSGGELIWRQVLDPQEWLFTGQEVMSLRFMAQTGRSYFSTYRIRR
jgi:hypothetical protein